MDAHCQPTRNPCSRGIQWAAGTATRWLDVWGHPLTAQARTIERIRRSNYGSLEVALTVDDPKAYTKTWTATIKLALALNTELLEYVCNENEKSLQHMIGPPAAQ